MIIFAILACSEHSLFSEKGNNDFADTSESILENNQEEPSLDPQDDPDNPTSEPTDEPSEPTNEPSEPTDEPLGSLDGQICDTTGNGWIIGAIISLQSTDGENIFHTITDQNGEFSLEGVPFGTYTLHVEKGSFEATETIIIDQAHQSLDNGLCLDPQSAKIAVVSGTYDEIEEILESLTIPYDEYDSFSESSYLSLLRNPQLLNSYDIVFFNCGFGTQAQWEPYQAEIAENLQLFVAHGGSMYASDWAYPIFESTFPDAVDFLDDDQDTFDVHNGISGTYTATVEDPILQYIVGSSTSITFDNSSWAVMEESNGHVLLSGDVETWSGTMYNIPLAVRYSHGFGQALFTSFHNDAQITATMEAILTEFIYSL